MNKTMQRLNKSEAREVEKAALAVHIGLRSVAVRSVSALIRAARTERSRSALLQVAEDLNLKTHPEFII